MKSNFNRIRFLKMFSLGTRGNVYEGFRGPLIRPIFFLPKYGTISESSLKDDFITENKFKISLY